MAAIAEWVALGATTATHQHGAGLFQAQLMEHPATTQVGPIADPAMATATAGAEPVQP